MSKSIRRLFPGGNTSKGFFSYYDYILPQEKANRIFVIKGGPGVGKSTFMKQIGTELADRGFDVEFLHCSSDPDSLDGVVVPALGKALIDGTAPHVVDPKNPGAVDEIINLGDFWREEGIKKNRKEVLEANAEIGRLFKRAYRYLAAAACVYGDNEEICKRAVDRQKVAKQAAALEDMLFADDEISEGEGRLRKMFATAITPRGLLSNLASALNTEKIIILKGVPGTGTERILEKIKDTALEAGYYVEAFYCAFLPEKLEHLVIPGKNTSIATSNRYHTVLSAGREVIDLDEFLDEGIIIRNKDVMEYNRLEFEGLLNRAVKTIEQAKALHDVLESYYIGSMDFEAIENYRRKIVDRILADV